MGRLWPRLLEKGLCGLAHDHRGQYYYHVLLRGLVVANVGSSMASWAGTRMEWTPFPAAEVKGALTYCHESQGVASCIVMTANVAWSMVPMTKEAPHIVVMAKPRGPEWGLVEVSRAWSH